MLRKNALWNIFFFCLFISFVQTKSVAQIEDNSVTTVEDEGHIAVAKEESVKKVSNQAMEKSNGNKDTINIPEELFDALKPVTEFYFEKIQTLLSRISTKSYEPRKKNATSSKKTKKISKSLFNAVVNPLQKFYFKRMNDLLPLDKKLNVKSMKNQIKKKVARESLLDPAFVSDEFLCNLCVKEGNNLCSLCIITFSDVCCDPSKDLYW